jgi:CheY-like chemotaxis protein
MTGEKKIIFWFEDDPNSLVDCCKEFRKNYNLVIGAHKGVIQRSRRQLFDLVLLDLMIHHKSCDYESEEEKTNIQFSGVHWTQTGVEFLRRIRKGEYQSYGFNKNIPVIVVTAVSDYPARDETETLGITDYFEKPVTLDQLEKSINRTFRITSNDPGDKTKPLLNKIECPVERGPDGYRLDGLRSKWQQIYHIAGQGMLEPDMAKIEEIDTIYQSIHRLTVSILQEFLLNEIYEKGLGIDSDWLVSWLASNALLSKRLNQYYGLNPGRGTKKENLINPIIKMRYLKHLGHHVLYTLYCAGQAERRKIYAGTKEFEQEKSLSFCDIPAEPGSSLSEAQLYIISEYAYREIGVHRELRIFERLRQQLSYELPLYAAGNFYRDHLYHVIDVCLLGELLLRSMLPGQHAGKKSNLLADRFKLETAAGFLQNWYVAALCHDLGYVIEHSEKFFKPIVDNQGQVLSGFSHMLKKGLEQGGKELKKVIKAIVKSGDFVIPRDLAEQLAKTSSPIDHGAAAWLDLRQRLKEINGDMKSLAPALTAIASHNLSGREIRVQKEPLTFLLMLCDHIQEWGRPRIGVPSLAYSIMEGLRFAGKPKLEKKVRMNRVIIYGLKTKKLQSENVLKETCDSCVYSGQSDPPCQTKCLRLQTQIRQNKGITFKLSHVEAREGDFEPCISWLLFCRDLQNIKYHEKTIPFPISIIMEHAPPRMWRELRWNTLEMDIFEEYANMHPSATYLCEWVEFARKRQQGIQYQGFRDQGKELFIINLKELGKPLRRGLLKAHWEDFSRWKRQWLSNHYMISNSDPRVPGNQ